MRNSAPRTYWVCSRIRFSSKGYRNTKSSLSLPFEAEGVYGLCCTASPPYHIRHTVQTETRFMITLVAATTLRTAARRLRLTLAVTAAISISTQSAAQHLTPAERAQVDSGAVAVLSSTGAPSASIAIVRGGQIVYERSYGNGRGATPATPSMRYAIGSVSKQFTATAILLLAEDRMLALADPVAKWLPQLTRARDITVGQLLSMTSGYQDYWPQDYVFSDMQRPATAETITQRWAGKTLDFEPGTKWQYSNTGYVIAAAIVERVAGMPFIDFLRQRIFTPLQMTSVADFDAGPLTQSDAGAYLRNALGPLRPAPKEGKGWLFGAGQLAMTAHDLALWNLAVIKQSVLRPASYKLQQTEILLEDGTGTGYGLGVGISSPGGRRRIAHGGAVSGYTTSNHIYPDDSAAIVVFTNIYPGAAGASGQIAGRIANVIFAQADTADAIARDAARRIYDGLTKGTMDRALFTPAANAYFSQEVLSDYAASLAPLGAPSEFSSTGKSLRGGMMIRSYRIRAGDIVMDLTTMTQPDGRIDQYLIAREG
jgi:D-alanyl-D-alanine carboxypeptidase